MRTQRPEIRIRGLIHHLGYRFRLHSKTLPGKPDLVFVGRRKVLFVHGCFWHQHERCKECRTPESGVACWQPKLQRNKVRDVSNRSQLRKLGWKSTVIWECELSQPERIARRIQRFLGPPRCDRG